MARCLTNASLAGRAPVFTFQLDFLSSIFLEVRQMFLLPRSTTDDNHDQSQDRANDGQVTFSDR